MQELAFCNHWALHCMATLILISVEVKGFIRPLYPLYPLYVKYEIWASVLVIEF